jgi:predicted nucleotidyltransferase
LDQLREEKQFVHSVNSIKKICEPIFRKVPEVECAYLFGSYARGETTFESDIDILVVCPPIGMKFFSMAADLDAVLGKEVDLQTHRQLVGDDTSFLESFLKDAIKIYHKN